MPTSHEIALQQRCQQIVTSPVLSPEQKRHFLALEAENNSDGVKKQKGKKTVTCISPVNVRTEPNISTSQVLGALTTGEEVEML